MKTRILFLSFAAGVLAIGWPGPTAAETELSTVQRFCDWSSKDDPVRVSAADVRKLAPRCANQAPADVPDLCVGTVRCYSKNYFAIGGHKVPLVPGSFVNDSVGTFPDQVCACPGKPDAKACGISKPVLPACVDDEARKKIKEKARPPVRTGSAPEVRPAEHPTLPAG